MSLEYVTTQDMDLGSLGGTLIKGAVIKPITEGGLRGNVLLQTVGHWVDRPEGQIPIIGGWPEAFVGKVQSQGG